MLTNTKSNILFITLGDQTGANTALIKVAESLHQKGHRVEVLVRDKVDYNVLITKLPPRKNYSSLLGHLVEKNGVLKAVDRDPKYIFNTINEENSYQDTSVILQHLKFIPQIIFVGITFDFLTSTDILNLSETTKAIVYNVAVDMNHFTGGCHFAWDCEGFIHGCDTLRCPAILDNKFKEIAGRNFRIKKNNVKSGNFKLLAGTKWTQKQALKSLIYKTQEPIFNISGVVDTTIYNPYKRHIAKEFFGLDSNIFYILAGAENTQDERKGYDYFVKTINLFWNKLQPVERAQIEVLSVTKILDEPIYKDIKFKKKQIPYIKDERLLSSLYQAADVYVNCSVEDSGPSMLAEAMACGTPVVSFDMGSAQEFVIDKETGYIVQNKDSEALSEALLRIFNTPFQNRLKIGINGYKLVSQKGSLSQAVNTIDTILEYHQSDFNKYSQSISVALCTYNGQKYIAEQLDSILQQYLIPDEIIVCDDNSSDNTLNILQTYQLKFPDLVKIYKNDKRLGVIKNFEKAINLCTKEIIFLSDQDDIWLPKKISSIVCLFNYHPDVEAISHNLQLCSEDKTLFNFTMWDTMGFQNFLTKNYSNKDYLFHTLFFGNMVTGASLCFKKPSNPVVFHDHIPHVIHDYQLAITYLSKRNIYFHNECLGLYRQHSKQQIGAVLDKVVQHTKAINLFYELSNPLWNLLYINKRMKNEPIFKYVKPLQIKEVKDTIDATIKDTIITIFLPKNWEKQLRFLSGKIISKIIKKTHKE